MLSTYEYKQPSTSYVPNPVIVKSVTRKIHSNVMAVTFQKLGPQP